MKRYNKWTKSGRKYYQLRDSKGRFAGTQGYKKAHGQDVKRKSRAEKKRK